MSIVGKTREDDETFKQGRRSRGPEGQSPTYFSKITSKPYDVERPSHFALAPTDFQTFLRLCRSEQQEEHLVAKWVVKSSQKKRAELSCSRRSADFAYSFLLRSELVAFIDHWRIIKSLCSFSRDY